MTTTKEKTLSSQPSNVSNIQRSGKALLPPTYHVGMADQPIIQAKMMVGNPNDPLERAADEAGKRVVTFWQSGGRNTEGGIQPTAMPPTLQRETSVSINNSPTEASPAVTQQIETARGGGQPLPTTIQPAMESVLGADFSGVRLHTDERADALNRSLSARAFATGQDVFFRNGAFSTATTEGVRLLGHELGHVVQQRGNSLLQRQEALYSIEDPRHQEWRERLIALGFRENHIGNLNTLDGFSDAQISHYFDILERLIVGSDAITVGTGFLRGWNHDQDDLGLTTRGGDAVYHTPLHYAQRLEQLSGFSSSGGHQASSTHSAYYGFRRATPRIRLAGQPINVHPRGLYFIAAAQVGMDTSARTAGMQFITGQHYFVPALSQRALGDISRSLSSIQSLMIPRRQRGRRTPIPEELETPRELEPFRKSLGDIISSLNNIANDIALNREQQPEAHTDSAFNAWLDAVRPAQSGTNLSYLRSLLIPDKATEFPQFVKILIGILSGVPGSRFGAGAMDLHGTAHAMGLAVDMATARDSNAENRGIPNEYMIFVNYVIDHFPSPDLPIGTRAHAVHALSHTQRYALSNIFQTHRESIMELVTSLNEPVTATTERPSRESITRDNQIYRNAANAVSALSRSLNQATYLGRLNFANQFIGEGEQEHFEEIRLALARQLQILRELSRSRVSTISPLALQEQLERIQTAVRPLIAEQISILQHQSQPVPPITPRRGRRRTHRRISERLMTELSSINDVNLNTLIPTDWANDATRRWERRQMIALRELAHDGRFRNWAVRATSGEGGIYSQPDIYVLGIEGVHANPEHRGQFFGSHHWDVAPLSVIESEPSYRMALRADMAGRNPSELQAILGYLHEFPSAWHLIMNDTILQEEISRTAGTSFDEIVQQIVPVTSSNPDEPVRASH